MGKTKKVKSAGKFHARYGMKARRQYARVDSILRKPQECPACKRLSVKRVSTGIWKCRKCKAEFVGGAYIARTKFSKDSGQKIKNLALQGSK